MVMRSLKDKLARLGPGEHLSVPDLCIHEVDEAAMLAEDLHLSYDVSENLLTVANLQTFLANLETSAAALKPVERLHLPCNQTKLEQKETHKLGLRLALDVEWSRASDGERLVMTSRRESMDGGSDPFTAAFHEFATGMCRNQRIFSRVDFANFKTFLTRQLPTISNRGQFDISVVELAFDDTMQLQWDIGFRGKTGLSNQWFQVFLQKVTQVLGGRDVISLLISRRRSQRDGGNP